MTGQHQHLSVNRATGMFPLYLDLALRAHPLFFAYFLKRARQSHDRTDKIITKASSPGQMTLAAMTKASDIESGVIIKVYATIRRVPRNALSKRSGTCRTI